jgi:hypothetical protein
LRRREERTRRDQRLFDTVDDRFAGRHRLAEILGRRVVPAACRRAFFPHPPARLDKTAPPCRVPALAEWRDTHFS